MRYTNLHLLYFTYYLSSLQSRNANWPCQQQLFYALVACGVALLHAYMVFLVVVICKDQRLH